MIKRQLSAGLSGTFLTCLMLTSALLLSGCGGLEPAEEEVKKTVESLGGTMVVEEGHIVEINLDSSKVQDSHLSSFQSLPALRSLSLNYTDVSDAVFEVAAKIKSLKVLNVAETKISQKAADDFRASHPDIAVSGPGV